MKIVRMILIVLASIIFAFLMGAVVAQLGLKFVPRVFSTYLGTTIVTAIMIVSGFLGFKIFRLIGGV